MSTARTSWERESRHSGEAAGRLVAFAGGIGLLSLLGGAGLTLPAEDGARRFFFAYLVGFAFVLSLSLGALFFVMLQHLTRSGWSVVLRRIAELMAAGLIGLAALAVPVLLGAGRLYSWAQPAHATDALLAWKRPYLNVPLFAVRMAGYFAVWGILAWYFLRRSTQQDRTGEPSLTVRMERVSGPGMLLFGLTVTFAAFDLIMSLDAHWFSTIFGVYFFAGSAASFFAALTLAAMGLQRAGRLVREITVEHYHDLGKLLFAFVFFWAYIAFSQYMLIWYSNIPEETAWYLARQTGPWRHVAAALILGHFALPFAGLLSARCKRRRAHLAFWAAWVLVIHWLDLYWLIMPVVSPGRLGLGLAQVATLVGMTGLWLAGIAWWARGVPLLPERDPRLPESLAFENA